MPLYYKVFSIATLFTALSWLFVNLHLPGNSLFWNALQNSGHGIAFFFTTFVVLYIIFYNVNISLLSVLIVLTLLFLLGVAIELLQREYGRSASVDDLLMNATGIAIGVCVFTLIDKSTFIHNTLNLPITLLAITLIGWVLLKPATYLVANIFSPSHPVIMNFDTIGANAKLHTLNSQVDIDLHSYIWPENGTESLKTTFKPGRYSALKIMEPHKNWLNYNALTFDVMNATETKVNAIIRIDAQSFKHDEQYFPYINLTIPTGTSKITIFLDEIGKFMNVKNNFDFSQVYGILLYMRNNQYSKILYLDNFTLE